MTVSGLLRVFEIFVTQVNVLLFDQWRAEIAGRRYAVRGYRRNVLLLLHNYFEIVAWFGVGYMYFYRRGDIVIPQDGVEPTLLRVFRESLLMMVTYHPEKNEASTPLGLALLVSQSIIGLVMTLLVLARFLALLPVPRSMDEPPGPGG